MYSWAFLPLPNVFSHSKTTEQLSLFTHIINAEVRSPHWKCFSASREEKAIPLYVLTGEYFGDGGRCQPINKNPPPGIHLTLLAVSLTVEVKLKQLWKLNYPLGPLKQSLQVSHQEDGQGIARKFVLLALACSGQGCWISTFLWQLIHLYILCLYVFLKTLANSSSILGRVTY